MLGFYAALSIFDLEPLNRQINALPKNQAILAEPSILRLLGYMMKLIAPLSGLIRYSFFDK
ncbi:hypothetical protein CW749_20265 [Vibrio sp. vnigr-6D03]|nr:hypothetical protein CW749_20265 [Vibrio sp. vnigr-6D03]